MKIDNVVTLMHDEPFWSKAECSFPVRQITLVGSPLATRPDFNSCEKRRLKYGQPDSADIYFNRQ